MPVTGAPLVDIPNLLAAARSHTRDRFTPPPAPLNDEALTWHPFILAGAARSAMAEYLLDTMWNACGPGLHDKAVTLICPALSDGWGDLVLAGRICAAVQRHAPTARLTAVVPDTAVVAPLWASLTAAFDPAAVRLLSDRADPEAVPPCDLLVIAPDPSAARYSSPAMQRRVDAAAARHPTLVVSEYGSAAPSSPRWRTLATGLGPLTDGIFIDSVFAAEAAAHRSASPSARAEAMRTWLTTLPRAPEPRACTALILIYVREAEAVPAAIARALGAQPDGPGRALVLVLRHASGPAQVHAWRAAGLPVTWHADASAEAAPTCARVAPCPALSPLQFQAGLKVADFAAVTGDQSLAEAVAARVRFVYEVRDHKQTLMHRLLELASRFGPAAQQAMAPLDIAARGAPGPSENPVSDATWQAMCSHVCNSCDVTPRLLGRAARTPGARSATRDLEAAITAACELQPGGQDLLLVAHLRELQAVLAAPRPL